MKQMKSLFAVAVTLAVAQGLAAEKPSAEAAKPLRVGVFVDAGARESVFAFSQLAALSPDCTASYLDGAAVRAGALSGVDVLLMSSGSSVDISASLGEAGRAALERYIREGGAYLGSCDGALLMMEAEKHKGLGIVPFRCVEASPRGGATMRTVWAKCAKEMAGITPGYHTTTYHCGPVMAPCEGHSRLGDFTVMARFGGNVLTTKIDPDCPSMGGYASCVAGTYGRGRVWVFSDHPEANPNKMHLVVGGIQYLTGRKIAFKRRARRPGQLSVGWYAPASPGVEGAAFAMELLKDDALDVQKTDEVSPFAMDAVVVCDSPDAARLKNLARPESLSEAERYLAAGGHVVAWGRGADALSSLGAKAGFHRVEGPAAAHDVLRALHALPLPQPSTPAAALPRRPGAVRTGFLLGNGSNGACLFRLLRMVAESPDYDVKFLLGSDVAAGALKDADLLIVPGGWSQDQFRELGAAGRTNLVSWIRGGGAYYGTCAGAYLVGQSKGKIEYMGVIPYRPQTCPYRGNTTDMRCAFTARGQELLGLGEKTFSTLYWGGPVMEPVPETALPDSDLQTLAVYNCQNVYSFSTNTLPAMAGRAAAIGGRLGKGRLVAMAPHPEYQPRSRFVVRAAMRYLTGKEIAAKPFTHSRGNLAVGFWCGSFARRETGDLAVALMGMPHVNLKDVSASAMYDGVLDHLDIVVLPSPGKSSCAALAPFASRGVMVYACARTKAARAALRVLPAERVKVFADEKALAAAIGNIPRVCAH